MFFYNTNLYISTMNKEEAINYILNNWNKPYAHVKIPQSTFSYILNRIKRNQCKVETEIEFFGRFGIDITIEKTYTVGIFNPLKK